MQSEERVKLPYVHFKISMTFLHYFVAHPVYGCLARCYRRGKSSPSPGCPALEVILFLNVQAP